MVRLACWVQTRLELRPGDKQLVAVTFCGKKLCPGFRSKQPSPQIEIDPSYIL
jgi:hypothetical protein